MADIKLTCDESPLAWPVSIKLDEWIPCTTCSIKVHSPQPGTLQVLTRRQGAGAGDGVNIEENTGVGADYRGQRYALQEAIFHTPGLHVFPGQKEVYPAEYHIHMRTMSAPYRYLTLVIPVSHLVDGPGEAYFAAISAKPDPIAKRPMLDSLLVAGTSLIQYEGPDIRGRTEDLPDPAANCNSTEERQFILVLKPTHIRAMDLERIPREGSLSTDPRDLPAPGVKPKRVVPRDRLLRVAVVAKPGILGPSSDPQTEGFQSGSGITKEMECKPVKVVNGRNVIEESGRTVDLLKALGINDRATTDETDLKTSSLAIGKGVTMFLGIFIGLLFADWVFGFLWLSMFEGSPRLSSGGSLTMPLYVLIATVLAFYPDSVRRFFGL